MAKDRDLEEILMTIRSVAGLNFSPINLFLDFSYMSRL